MNVVSAIPTEITLASRQITQTGTRHSIRFGVLNRSTVEVKDRYSSRANSSEVCRSEPGYLVTITSATRRRGKLKVESLSLRMADWHSLQAGSTSHSSQFPSPIKSGRSRWVAIGRGCPTQSVGVSMRRSRPSRTPGATSLVPESTQAFVA